MFVGLAMCMQKQRGGKPQPRCECNPRPEQCSASPLTSYRKTGVGWGGVKSRAEPRWRQLKAGYMLPLRLCPNMFKMENHGACEHQCPMEVGREKKKSSKLLRLLLKLALALGFLGPSGSGRAPHHWN